MMHLSLLLIPLSLKEISSKLFNAFSILELIKLLLIYCSKEKVSILVLSTNKLILLTISKIILLSLSLLL